MIEVFRDEWGIPHLRAGSHLELAFAQGRNAVQDRGDQVALAGRKARGRAAAVLGPTALPWDRFARQALLDDTGRRCFATLQPATAEWVSSFVDGVNLVLDDEPWDPWTPLSVWVATHVLFAGLGNKLWRSEVADRLGPSWLSVFSDEDPFGSNGWLVSGAHSGSGLPLLAGDPHRQIDAPGVYQQVRLACDDYDVLGLAVPGVPGLAHFGHAGSVAWCITNAMSDYQDLLLEDLRRVDGRVEARGPSGWEPVAARVESVEVAGAAPVEVEVLETARGPVVEGLGDARLSLRHPIRSLAASGFDVLPLLLRARTVADVDAALEGWVEPVNVVLAGDTRGGLLHRVAGRVPVRSRAAMLHAVPAWAPGNEWQGWHRMPGTAVGDVAVMANERSLAADLGVDFSAPHRAERIRSLLSAQTWTPAQLASVHMDTANGAVSALVSRLHLPGLSPAASALAASLASWDQRMAGDSVEAAAYSRLRAAVAVRLATHPVLEPLSRLPSYSPLLAPWLDAVPRLGKALERLLPAVPDLEPVLVSALEEVASLPPARWDALHVLAPVSPRPTGEPWPGCGGDQDCVLATSSLPGVTHAFTRGPAARYVWDLASRGASLWVVPLGASGVHGHRHERDQLPLWLSGRLVPVVDDWAELSPEV